MKISCLLVGLIFFLVACDTKKAEVKSVTLTSDTAWIDTVRFNDNLTPEQSKQVYYKRNFEEDYKQIEDTARVALRFFWYRSFHPYTVVRIENRPENYMADSSGKQAVYTEWFAVYKINIQRLNHDCPARKGDKCSGKVRPYLWQQNVNLLLVNKTPAIIAALDSIKFWNMKEVYASPAHTDGSNWTLQVYYHGKYHEVSTDMQSHPIKQICLRMLKLSGYKLKSREIY